MGREGYEEDRQVDRGRVQVGRGGISTEADGGDAGDEEELHCYADARGLRGREDEVVEPSVPFSAAGSPESGDGWRPGDYARASMESAAVVRASARNQLSDDGVGQKSGGVGWRAAYRFTMGIGCRGSRPSKSDQLREEWKQGIRALVLARDWEG